MAKTVHEWIREMRQSIPGCEHIYLLDCPEICVRETRHMTEESYVLDALGGIWEAGGFHRTLTGWFISTRELVAEIPEERGLTVSRAGRMLKGRTISWSCITCPAWPRNMPAS